LDKKINIAMKFEEKFVPTTSTIFISDFSEYRPLLELSKEAIFEEKLKIRRYSKFQCKS